MAISSRVADYMKSASWIRRMFEQGAALKREHGAENVFDFSLGNPDLPPPPAFSRALQAVAAEVPGSHRYMPNAGFPETRVRVASRVAKQHGVDPKAQGVIMTVGAAGALNVVLKATLDPGNEVVVPTPYFPEYRFYVDNHGGVLRTIPTTEDFDLDLNAFEDVLNENTRIVLVNSPNNPTGRVYSAETLRALGELMTRKCPQATLVSDEPYRQIVYGGAEVASVLAVTPMSAVATSFSKDLGLAGERIGYVAVHPDHPDREGLLAAAVFVNRTLGFVNAPALMQRVIARLDEVTVDLEVYAERRKLLLEGLGDAGYECVTPEGAFYLFPRSPLADDVAFVQALLEERILVVPGTGFGHPGNFRLSYAVPTETIHKALHGFRRVMEKIRATQ